MGLCVLVLFCLLSLTSFGNSSNKHMICTEAGDVFGDVTNNEIHTRRVIGPKGEQGIRGEKGFSGSDGLPGTIDYDRVQELVRLKVEEETQQHQVKFDKIVTQMDKMTSQISENRRLRIKVVEMETKIENMSSQISENRKLRIKFVGLETEIKNLTSQISENRLLRRKNRQFQIKVGKIETQLHNLTSQISENRHLQTTVGKMKTEIQNLTSQIEETRALIVKKPDTVSIQPTTVVQCVGGVIHEGICYWAEVDSSRNGNTNYAKAEKICSNKRSRLADILGKVHYDLIMNFLRGKLNGRSLIFAWTGMKKRIRNNIAQLSNGSPAPYTRQRSKRWEWDGACSRCTHVYLVVRSSTNDSDQGMGACTPTGCDLHGALCQTE